MIHTCQAKLFTTEVNKEPPNEQQQTKNAELFRARRLMDCGSLETAYFQVNYLVSVDSLALDALSAELPELVKDAL